MRKKEEKILPFDTAKKFCDLGYLDDFSKTKYIYAKNSKGIYERYLSEKYKEKGSSGPIYKTLNKDEMLKFLRNKGVQKKESIEKIEKIYGIELYSLHDTLGMYIEKIKL